MNATSCGRDRPAAPPRDGAKTALLLVDFINALDFERGEALRAPAEAAARRTAALKSRLTAQGIPAIYANDNFRRWRSNFPELVEAYSAPDCRGRELARLLKPEPDDLSVLKPRHSAFYGTPLDHLLRLWGVDTLVICGTVANICVHYTAASAALRWYEVVIPRDTISALDPFDLESSLRQTAFLFAGRITTAAALIFEARRKGSRPTDDPALPR